MTPKAITEDRPQTKKNNKTNPVLDGQPAPRNLIQSL